MNRDAGAQPAEVLSFGSFRLWTGQRRLERDGQIVKLGSRALEILIALTERPGEVVRKEDLIARAWPDTAVDESGLRVQLVGLRKVLGDGIDGARYVTNVPGRGYAFVAPVTRASLAAESAAAPYVPRTPGDCLPPRLERIVGREEATREISEQILHTRFVSIVGPGGMGKTTVALAVAHGLVSAFARDVVFVDLGAVMDPRQVLPTIAATLGLVLQTDDAFSSLAAFLRDRRPLLVLDCCEHVVDAVAPVAERLVRELAGIHLLATSREALRVEGEHVYRVLPLESPPEDRSLTAQEALAFPAVQLFVERAKAAGARLTLTDAEAPVVADICRRLDGIALAIEFAAASVDAYGVRGTASLLENRFKLLWHGRRTALPRHQTLGSLLDWSHNLLGEQERRVLRRLSIFVGPFALEAAAAVAADADLDGEVAVELLGSLLQKSLVSMDLGGTPGHFRLLDTIRAYALAKLDDAAERDAVARRHAEYLRDILDHERRIVAGVAAVSFAGHLGNTRAALTWCFAPTGDAQLGVRLAAASAPMFMELSLLGECNRWVEAAFEALAETDRGTRLEMDLQVALGVSMMFMRGNGADVRAALLRGLALADEVDDPREQLRMLGALHILLLRRAELSEALSVAHRGEEVARRLKDPAAEHVASWMIGASAHLLGDLAEGERRCVTALAATRVVSKSAAMLQFGFDHRVRALAVMGQNLWLRGRAEEGMRVAFQAIREAEELGQPTTVAFSLVWTSPVFLRSGDVKTASDLIERLISFAEKQSLGPYYRVGLGLKAELAVTCGDSSGVLELQRLLEALHGERHYPLHTVFTTALAQGLAIEGRFVESLTAIDDGLAAAARSGGSADTPEMLRVKAWLLGTMPSPDTVASERCILQALEGARAQKALAWELRIATTAAALWSGLGRAEEARALLQGTYEQFTQGLQTADVLTARRLLAEL